jgi:hypothetical protein
MRVNTKTQVRLAKRELSDFVPKGLQGSARPKAFGPGRVPKQRLAVKGRNISLIDGSVWPKLHIRVTGYTAHFGAGRFFIVTWG